MTALTEPHLQATVDFSVQHRLDAQPVTRLSGTGGPSARQVSNDVAADPKLRRDVFAAIGRSRFLVRRPSDLQHLTAEPEPARLPLCQLARIDLVQRVQDLPVHAEVAVQNLARLRPGRPPKVAARPCAVDVDLNVELAADFA